MKREIINYNEQGYKNSIKCLKDAVNTINKYTLVMNRNGYQLTNELLKDIANDYRWFRQLFYLDELQKVADLFGVDFDEIKTKQYTMINPMFQLIAANKSKWMDLISNEIWKCILLYKWLPDYIEITDNVASIKDNAEKDIKELFTLYTKNERQNKVLSILREIQGLYKELEKQGINKADHLINDYTNEIELGLFLDIVK